MISPLQATLRAAITDTVTRLYGLDAASLPAIAVEVPPRRALGDLAVPLAFELARRLRKAPRAIAQEIVAALGPLEGISKAEAAPNGYINVFFDRAGFVRRGLADGTPAAGTPPPARRSAIPRVNTIVEHTAINPNKAAHIGHLRNSTLGDTFVRLLRFCGVPVEVQNYIDDTGVQVADVVVGFRELEGKSLDEIRTIADTDALRLLLLGPLREGHRVVRRRQGTPRGPRPGAPRHRARRQRRPPRSPPSSPTASSTRT